MLIDLTKPLRVTIRREVTDPKFGQDDSWFLYRLRNGLKKLGYDAIKKLAYKDGNLVDDHMHYVRDRKNRWVVYDHNYNVRSLAQAFDTDGEVTLTLTTDDPKGGLLK